MRLDCDFSACRMASSSALNQGSVRLRTAAEHFARMHDVAPFPIVIVSKHVKWWRIHSC